MGRRSKKHIENTGFVATTVGDTGYRVHGDYSLSPAPAQPKPVETSVVKTCETCRWSKVDQLSSEVGGGEAKGHLNCTESPPVFVGYDYEKRTQLSVLKGFSYPKVEPKSVCSLHEDRS